MVLLLIKGIAQASLETMVPIAFGVVTSENLEWAATKGFDAAITPIEEVVLYR